MELDITKYDYDTFTQDATGRTEDSYRIISFPFDKYDIKVKVGINNEFLGIVEVGINKDFLSQKQKFSLKGYHDVEEYYVD